MLYTVDTQRLEAFEELLARPDPKDLPRRAHVLRCSGDPARQGTRLPPILMAWLQRRCLDIDGEDPLASATRVWKPRATVKTAGLQLLRPTGTA